MEEKMTELLGASARITEGDGIYGAADEIFMKWRSEGMIPADMYKVISELFDCDPQGAEKLFGRDFMDTIDYFTHYWA